MGDPLLIFEILSGVGVFLSVIILLHHYVDSHPELKENLFKKH